MEAHDPIAGSRGFGLYLRRVREQRRLSLDAVEELTSSFPERVTKSHLSRIENGQAMPSFPRLLALGRVYGVPLASLAERFEIELGRDAAAPREVPPHEALLAETERLRLGGQYLEALALLAGALEREDRPERLVRLRLEIVNCLVHLGRYETAKTDCEELLGSRGLDPLDRIRLLQLFIICCQRLGRVQVAVMGLEQAERAVAGRDVPARMRGDLEMVRGTVRMAVDDHEAAIEAYRRAQETYAADGRPFEACRAEVNLAAALLEAGRTAEARERLARVLAASEEGGYDRIKALALSHLALLSYRDGDLATAEASALRSNAIARPREYTSVLFRNCFYLWRIARGRGDEQAARINERTLRTYLGRVEEHQPEVEEFRAHLAGGEE